MKNGTLVRIGELPSLHELTGCLGRIHRTFGVHTAYDGNGVPFKVTGYGVTMLDTGRKMIVPYTAVEIEDEPESRGDLDQVVSWESLAAVVGWRPAPEDLV